MVKDSSNLKLQGKSEKKLGFKAVASHTEEQIQQKMRLSKIFVTSGTFTGYAKFALSITITGIFFYLLLHNLNRGAFVRSLLKISFSDLFIALIFLGADYFMRIFRWWLMLREMEPELSIKACIWPYIVSIAINDVIPFRVGDGFRAFGFRKDLQTPPFRIVGTLVIERVLDLIVLLAIFFITITKIPDHDVLHGLITSATWILFFVMLASLVAILFPRQLYAILTRMINSRVFVRYKLNKRILSYLDNLLEPLRLLRSFQFTLKMILITMVIWLLEGFIFITIARGVGILATPTTPLFSMALGTLGTLLPSSPGYFGTFDYFAMYGMLTSGINQDSSTAFALIVHFILWFPLVLAGITYYFTSSIKAIPLLGENE